VTRALAAPNDLEARFGAFLALDNLCAARRFQDIVILRHVGAGGEFDSAPVEAPGRLIEGVSSRERLGGLIVGGGNDEKREKRPIHGLLRHSAQAILAAKVVPRRSRR
jgi:hypothetical protein